MNPTESQACCEEMTVEQLMKTILTLDGRGPDFKREALCKLIEITVMKLMVEEHDMKNCEIAYLKAELKKRLK